MKVPTSVLRRAHDALVVAEQDALAKVDEPDGRRKWLRAMWARADFEVYVARELPPPKVLVVDIDIGARA